MNSSGSEDNVRAGFTYLELLVSMLILTIVSLSLAHSLSLSFQSYLISSERWSSVIELWNRATLARELSAVEETRDDVGDGNLEVILIESPQLGVTWEVVRVRK